MITAWRERDGERVEVLASEALSDEDQSYRCIACNEPVFPRAADPDGSTGAHFEHAPGAPPCRRNPRRQDRRSALRMGGRRSTD